MENVTYKFGGRQTYKNREGFLSNGNQQPVVYTDYSGRSNGKSAIALVWGMFEHQNEESFLNVSESSFGPITYTARNQPTDQPEQGELKAIERAATRFPNAEIRTDSQRAKQLFKGRNTVIVVQGHNNADWGIQKAHEIAKHGKKQRIPCSLLGQ